jgi:SAM-dependent methyltransferase
MTTHTIPTHTVNWASWLQRWDVQQTGYLPEREERFGIMFDVLDILLGQELVVLDLACGPGSLSQRLLRRFPRARSVAVDLDPVLLTMGQAVLGDTEGRLRWVETDLQEEAWVHTLGETQFDAVLSTTALHWLPVTALARLYKQLGELVRPGGVFLNGDHIRFGPQMKAFQQVADAIRDTEQQDAFERRGVEDWKAWWSALEQEPGVEALLAEREFRFGWRKDAWTDPSYELQVAALQEAGFGEVGTIWQRGDNRVLMAVRG